jgi:IS5 family transposase
MFCIMFSTKKTNTKQKGPPMREIRTVQTSIFDFYSQHEKGLQLKRLSEVLDGYPELIELVGKDLVNETCSQKGRKGLSVDSVFRCLLLKQLLQVSYEELSFHLSDSQTYRTFARLSFDSYPSKSTLQANLRRLRPVTLAGVFEVLTQQGFDMGTVNVDTVRIDSTVVKSNIAPPSDSRQLNDSVRVLSRCLAKSQAVTGVKVRFRDFRKASKSLAFGIFNGKKAEKDELYEELLIISKQVAVQVGRAIEKVRANHNGTPETSNWLENVDHYLNLLRMVIDQSESRVIDEEEVCAEEKVVSIFEPHADIIIKGNREVEYGHKVNIASDLSGLLTHVSIEEGNASDVERFLPILEAHEKRFNCVPSTVVSDGGYASRDNVAAGRAKGVKRVVFHKKKGISLKAMGVKQKTYDRLKDFRAGIEGNISELKRAFAMGKALWKGYEGFHAYVWASVITYNLVRLARIESG